METFKNITLFMLMIALTVAFVNWQGESEVNRTCKSSLYLAEKSVEYFESHYLRRIGVKQYEEVNILSLDGAKTWIVVRKKDNRVLGYLEEIYPEAYPSDFIPEKKLRR